MNGRYLLDTNIVIAVFAEDTSVLERLAQASEVFVLIIVFGELYYGARRSTHIDANINLIDELAGSTALLACDLETSRQYGQLKNDIRAKGRPIPEDDIWIAASAQQHGLTLVSRYTL